MSPDQVEAYLPQKEEIDEHNHAHRQIPKWPKMHHPNKFSHKHPNRKGRYQNKLGIFWLPGSEQSMESDNKTYQEKN